jgi:hypothetical protein
MEMKYCYSCRTHHESTVMALYPTKRGYRWRCKNSIEATMTPKEIRDQFGRYQTEINKNAARQAAELIARRRVPTMAA